LNDHRQTHCGVLLGSWDNGQVHLPALFADKILALRQ
jgi:hypothetical protein